MEKVNMKCDECQKEGQKLTYYPNLKKYLCKDCRPGKKPNIFIVHQAIKRANAPLT